MSVIDAVATNNTGLQEAQQELATVLVERLTKDQNMHGRVTVEVFVTDGIITGHETHVRKTTKNRPVKRS